MSKRSIVAAFAFGGAIALSGCVEESSYRGPSNYPVARRDYSRYDAYDRYDRTPVFERDDPYGRSPPPRYERYDRYPPSDYGRYPTNDRSAYDRRDDGPYRYDRRPEDRRDREVDRDDRDQARNRPIERRSRDERPNPEVPQSPPPQTAQKPSLSTVCSGEGENRRCRLQGNNAFRQ